MGWFVTRGDAATDWEGGYRVEAFVHSPLLPAQVAGTTWDGIAHSSVRVVHRRRLR